VPFENIPAEDRTGQGQKRFVNVGWLFIANSQSTKPIQPIKSPFHNLSTSTQSIATLSALLSLPRIHATLTLENAFYLSINRGKLRKLRYASCVMGADAVTKPFEYGGGLGGSAFWNRKMRPWLTSAGSQTVIRARLIQFGLQYSF
jgi:hypothetical protein